MQNIIIVDDDTFFKQALAYQFKKSGDFDVVKTFENGRQIVDYTPSLCDEIIIMDVAMPEMDGICAVEKIKKINPKIKIIMLSSNEDKGKVISAFSAGANAYCTKQIKIDELKNVIDIISQGGFWVDKRIASYIFEILQNINTKNVTDPEKKSPYDFGITKSEINVLKLISQGYTNSQIADELFISLNTVKNHVASIISKLQVKDRTQIAIFALKNMSLD